MKIVLLADDDARQRAESADLLRRCGCSVVAVRDADDALETFAGHHEDIGLVIVDAELPPKGAASLLHDIARIKPDVQCLLTRHEHADIARERDARPMRSFGHRLARVAHATPRVIAKRFKVFWRSVRRSSDDRDNSLDGGGA